jgi:hypothetical protein
VKIRFYCDSGANIHSCHEEVVDLAEVWGCSEEEAKEDWEGMSDDDKYEEAEQWAYNNGLEIGWEEIE